MAKLKVSSAHRFVEAFPSEKIWVGVDVHKRTFSVALLRPDGVIKDWSSPADVDSLTQTLSSLPLQIGAVCYEAGPTGFGLARSLRAAGLRGIVAAPSRIPRPVSPTNKTDSLDCRKLTEYAASGLIDSIAVLTEKEEAFRFLERRRHQLTDSCVKPNNVFVRCCLHWECESPMASTIGARLPQSISKCCLSRQEQQTRSKA